MPLIRASLFNLVGMRGLVGCEIGTFAGENAESMLEGLDIARLYLIDPYVDPAREKTAHERIDGKHGDKVVWLRKRSQDVTAEDIPSGSLDFVYIDGDHSYEAVRDDIRTFLPLMKRGCGALLAGHDYGKAQNEKGQRYYVKTGVKQAVDEFCLENGYGQPYTGLMGGREDWWIFLKN